MLNIQVKKELKTLFDYEKIVIFERNINGDHESKC